MTRLVRTDCRHYRGSQPCAPHKEHGVVCSACEYYAVRPGKIAVIKLGAMGDVLRTTALLRDIAAAHPNAGIVWFTRADSARMLRGVAQIETVVDVDSQGGGPELRFDALYNLDNDDESVALAATLASAVRRGFRIGASGHCEGVYDGCDPTLYELGLWDDLKRANRRSYLSLLASAAGLTYSGGRPVVQYEKRHEELAVQFVAPLHRPLVAINTDTGTRWLRKQWNLSYVETAVAMLVERGFGVVILGGVDLQSFNEQLAHRFEGMVAAAPTWPDVRGLFATIAQADVLLTGDTLAMHAAWGLGVPVVALFGPTSLHEIDLAEGDLKLAATDLECLGCYRKTCDVQPHCMDRLTPETIVRAIEQRLSSSQREAIT